MKDCGNVEQSSITHQLLKSCGLNTDFILVNEPDLDHTLDLVDHVQMNSG